MRWGFSPKFFAIAICLWEWQVVLAQTVAPPASTGVTQPSDAQIAVNEDNYVAWDAPEQPIGPNHRTTFRNNGAGQREIVGIGTGMNYWDGVGWSPSIPQFVQANGGFVASQVQHQVQLGNNLMANGSVSVRMPDGIVLSSTPVAIALYDAASGNFQVISTITNCAPTQISSNEVMYIDAFSGGVCASVVYTITASGFHQDVFITGHLDPADYGFATNTTQIQILTEFYGAPTPDVLERPIYIEQDPNVRASMASPDLIDEELGFGQFVMTTGKAYVAPNAANPAGNEVPVTKTYQTIAGHTYLFESVPFVELANDLLALPPCGNGGVGGFNSTGLHGYAGIPKLPKHPAKFPAAKLASHVKPPGVVIDYVASIGGTLSGTTTFKNDTTYLVSSSVTCNGPAIVEGGAVFKYKSGTSITLNSTLTCKSGMYRPAVFTGVDDNSVGDTMYDVTNSGYSGTISSNGYANPALNTSYALTFSNLRFRYAQEAIKVTDNSSTTWSVSHSQFLNCIKGIEVVSANGCGCGCGTRTSYFTLNNCLMNAVNFPVISSSTSLGCSPTTYQYITLLNCTFDQSSQLATNGGYCLSENISATNSVFANITKLTNGTYLASSSGALSGGYNGFFSAGAFGSSTNIVSSSPFQSVGAGGHYLTLASGFRDYGGGSLPISLISDLQLRTTYPPTNVTFNTTITNSATFVPQAPRDTNTLDLGYHYDPLDYAFANVYVTNAAISMSNGVAIATFGTNNTSFGLGIGRAATLYSVGTPNNPDWIVVYNTVMEGVGTNGNWQPPTNSVTGELYGQTPAPKIYTRFTSWSAFVQDVVQFYAPTNLGPIAFQDNEFHDGKIISYQPTIDLTNCLLERVCASLSSTDTNSPYIRNNLFLGGTFNFAPNVTNAFVKDNLFDQTSIPTNTSVYTTYNGGYNGFVTNNNRLLPTNSTDVILISSPSYQTGPLGFYYQPTNSYLINFGHTNANYVGLYDYTVTSNLVSGLELKETNSIVDIGYHYVAVDSNGIPQETDWLGVPDYLADANGDGALPAWLIKYFGHLGVDPNADYDGDGTNNLQEFLNGADPNKISFTFSVTNPYVTTNVITGVVTVLGGVPSSFAVLVDNTNFSTATWTAYSSSNIVVNITTNQGAHDAWIGLRGLPSDAYQTWQETTLVLDSISPSISITNPVNHVSFNASRVDINGNFTASSLQQITVNGVLAFVNGTNFDALNVPLVGGTNVITAVIEDLTGYTNTASIQIVATTNTDGSLNNPVQLQATPVAGFSPLPVSFQTQTNLPGTMLQVAYDFNGDDIVDFVTNTLGSVVYTYATNGTYFPVVTVQTSAGRFSSIGGWNSVVSVDTNQTIRVNVQAPATMTTFVGITDPIDLKWAGTNLYVLSGSTATVTEFATNGSSVRSLSGLGTNPSGIDVDSSGNVYVAVTGSNQVWKLNPTTSSFAADTNFGAGGHLGLSNGASGSGTNGFNAPFDVAVSPDGGTISVSDSGNNRIQQFVAANGSFVASFGTNGSAPGQFNTPKGLTYDSSGSLYVMDSGNNRIVVTDANSNLEVTGTNGTDLGKFSNPANICIGRRGIYVADTGNNRIQKFSLPAGHEQFSINPIGIQFALSTNFNQPYAVAAVNNNFTNDLFYVADTGNNRVVLCTAPTTTTDTVLAVWNSMVSHLNSNDITGAVACFSVVSSDKYRDAFLAVGTGSAIAAISQIGALTPTDLEDDTAQFYFQQSIDGQTITFPVEFDKENGQWKIIQF